MLEHNSGNAQLARVAAGPAFFDMLKHNLRAEPGRAAGKGRDFENVTLQGNSVLGTQYSAPIGSCARRAGSPECAGMTNFPGIEKGKFQELPNVHMVSHIGPVTPPDGRQ